MSLRKTFAVLIAAAASAAAVAATESIRIMTYNIPMGNIKVTDGNGRNTWENRCNEIHKYLLDVAPDLLGMQEPVRAELCDILRGIPNYAMVGTGRDKGADGGEYTAILYRIDRFRVLETGNYWLTDTPEEPSRVEGSTHLRIATWALMEDLKSGARFLFTNTHLSYDSEPVRMAQIRVIKQKMLDLNNQYGEDLPHFFTGDFNMKDSEENYNYVLNWKLIMKDLWSSTRDRHHYSTGKNSPTGRIDYVFATKNVTSVMARWDNRKTTDGFWMSDHDPLWADATFQTSVADDARAAVSRARTEVDSVYTFSQLRNRLITTVSQLTTDGVEKGSSLSYAIDLNTTTTFHSQKSGTAPAAPHYLQVEMRQAGVENFRFTYTRRKDNDTEGRADRMKDLMITASDDGQKWDYIQHVYNFGDDPVRSYTSENIALRRPYKYIRFSVLRTPGETLRNGHPQFSAAEFQLYPNEIAANSPYMLYPEVKEAADKLKTLAAEVQTEAENGTATRERIAQLEEAIETLRAARAKATAINRLSADVMQQTDVYDLQGRRLASLGKGIRIRDGRKVLY